MATIVQKELLTENGKPIKRIKIANITMVIPEDCDVKFYKDEYINDAVEETVKETGKFKLFDKLFRFRKDR